MLLCCTSFSMQAMRRYRQQKRKPIPQEYLPLVTRMYYSYIPNNKQSMFALNPEDFLYAFDKKKIVGDMQKDLHAQYTSTT